MIHANATMLLPMSFHFVYFFLQSAHIITHRMVSKLWHILFQLLATNATNYTFLSFTGAMALLLEIELLHLQ